MCRKVCGRSFIGVFPCDIQPEVRRKTFSIVFNTGDSSTAGEHFVAIFSTRRTMFYFDSFGKKPTDNNIKKFIAKTKGRKRFIHWKKQIQHSMSNYCGFYCIGYLLHKHKNIQSFRKYFNANNLMQNDGQIVKFIVKNV